MLKKIFVVTILIILVTSCGEKKSFKSGFSSNKLDSNDQIKLKDILVNNNISNIDTFLSWFNKYNDSVDASCRLNDWIETGKLEYNEAKCVESYENKFDTSDGNCRLTAYTLIMDLITTTKKINKSGTYLMFDVDVIDSNEDYKVVKDNYDEFITLFNEIDVNKLNKDDIKYEFGNHWKRYGINLNSDTVSLISIVLHDNYQNVIFVGHTGVLIELNDKLLFIEKIAFEQPYQITVLENLDELKKMISKRESYFSNDGEEGPFIYQNDKLLFTFE